LQPPIDLAPHMRQLITRDLTPTRQGHAVDDDGAVITLEGSRVEAHERRVAGRGVAERGSEQLGIGLGIRSGESRVRRRWLLAPRRVVGMPGRGGRAEAACGAARGRAVQFAGRSRRVQAVSRLERGPRPLRAANPTCRAAERPSVVLSLTRPAPCAPPPRPRPSNRAALSFAPSTPEDARPVSPPPVHRCAAPRAAVSRHRRRARALPQCPRGRA
jgi:hypothetical protein